MRTICINRLMTLVAFLLLSVVYASAFEVDGINYSITNESLGYVQIARTTGITMERIEIPAQVTYQGKTYTVVSNELNALADMQKTKSISFPSTIREFYQGVCYSCPSLEEVILSEGLEVVGYHSFGQNVNLQQIILPSTVKEIRGYAFLNCKSATFLSLPENLKTIEEQAFVDCASLNTVYCFAKTPPTFTGGDSFYGVSSHATLYVYPTSIEAYQKADYWKNFAEIKALPDDPKRPLKSPVISCDKENRQITISHYDENVEIYYTLDGTDPTTDGILYTEPISYNRNLVIKAVAKREGYYNSVVTTYTITDVNSTFVVDDICYKLIDNTTENVVEVTYGKNYTGKIIIPTTFIYVGTQYTVKGIGPRAFNYCKKLTGISFPNTIEYIGEEAFQGCSSLTTIDIPTSVKSIDNYAFQGCSNISNATFHEGLEIIGDNAFSYTALKELILPLTMKSIGSSAFDNCYALSAVELPDNIEFLGGYSFASCRSLYSFKYPKNLKTIEAGVTCDCQNLTIVLLPEGVTSLGRSLFDSDISLKSITLPSTLTYISGGVFLNCNSLTNIYCLAATPPDVYGSALSYVKGSATLFVPTKSLDAYRTATGWSEFATISALDKLVCSQPTFGYSNYTLTMSTLTSGATIFYTTDGTEPTENSIEYTSPIPYFKNCTIRAIAHKAGYDVSPISEFRDDNMKVPTPQVVMSDDYIVSITCEAPDLVGFPETKIYYRIYTHDGNPGSDCLYEQPFELKSACTIIVHAERDGWINSDQGGIDCYTDYYVESPTIDWNSEQQKVTITHNDPDVRIYYTLDGSEPTENSTLYLEPFSVMRNVIVNAIAVKPQRFNSGIKTLTINNVNSTFYVDGIYYKLIDNSTANEVEVTSGKKYSGDIKIPEKVVKDGVTYSVVRIGYMAFYDCDALGVVTIPNTVTSIGKQAFQDCSYFKKVEIPGSVHTIEERAFYLCYHYQTQAVVLHEGLQNIGDLAFGYNYDLKEIKLPSTLRSIGSNAFIGCSSLSNIIIPEGIKSLPDNIFNGASKLQSISLPSGLEEIGVNAFAYCTALSVITLPEKIRTIENDAFSNCSALTDVYSLASTPPTLKDGSPFKNVTDNATLHVKKTAVAAYRGANYWSDFSNIVGFDKDPCAQPAFEYSNYLLSMKTTTEDASIYYTTDGTEPTVLSTLYTAPLSIRQNVEIRAIAVCEGYENSLISRYAVEFKPQKPVAMLSDDYKVTLSCDVPDSPDFPTAHIYYYLSYDSGTPSKSNCKLYEGPIQLVNATYVHAYATWEGGTDSEWLSANYYTNYNVALPTLSWDADSKTLTMSHTDDTAIIFYTVDDTQPSTSSIRYTGPVNINRNSKIRAVAYKSGRLCSQESTLTISVDSRMYIDGIYYQLTPNSMANEVEVTSGKTYSGDIIIPQTITNNGTSYSVVGIAENTFASSKISSIQLPATIRYIGESAFANSSLVTINLPDALTDIGSGAFYSCKKLSSINIPLGVTEIKSSTFCYCRQLQSITIPNTIESIGGSAFEECQMSEFVIPEGVKMISDRAFCNCTQLASISLPSTITTIGWAAFSNSNALKTVYSAAPQPPVMKYNGFDGVTSHATLYVKDYAKEAYETALFWAEFPAIETYGLKSAGKPVFALSDYRLTITSATEGAKIYYTTDGTEPTKESQLYTEPIALVKNDTIKAIATCDGYDNSLVETFAKRDFKVATPVVQLSAELKMTITCESDEGLAEPQIYYQKNNKNNSFEGYDNWTLYKEPVQLREAGHVRVLAKRDGWLDSELVDYDFYTDYSVKSPSVETIADKNAVVITHDDADVKIRYTLDGSEPTAQSTLYTDTIRPTQNAVVKAIVTKAGKFPSLAATKTVDWFTISEPTITISRNVATIRCEEPKAVTIYYTLDGSKPTTQSVKYEAPITLKTDGTIRALAVADNWNDSPVTTFKYRAEDYTCKAPELNRYKMDEEGNMHMTEDVIFVASETKDATFYYTLDGTEPTDKSTLYKDSIQLTGNCLVRVVAVKQNMMNSPISRKTVDWFAVATPRIAFEGKMCHLTCKTEGVTLYYTIDDSDPTAESLVYKEPIALPAQQTNVKVIAMRENWYHSSTATRTYYPGGNTCEVPVIARVIGTDSVQISTRTEGSTIYYTTNGLNPTTGDSVYTKPFLLMHNGTLRAIATNPIYYDSDVASLEVNWFKVAQPIITVEDKVVKMTCNDANASIHYTLDGSDPTEENTVYRDPLTMTGSCTIKAIASKDGFNSSIIAKVEYRASEHTCGKPMFTKTGDQIMITATPEENTTIHYTLDGSAPTTKSDVYTGPMDVTENMTIRAIATNPNLFQSDEGVYEINWFKVETPEIVFNGINASMSCGTAGATIYYTTDGTTPTEESLRYTKPVKLTTSCTVKAIAMKENFNNSLVATNRFERSEHTAETPQFQRLQDSVMIITSNVEGTVIYYTLDGTDPTTGSDIYSKPIPVSGNCTLKVMVVQPDFFPSDIAVFEVNWFKVEAPVVTLDGFYVTMSCSTPDARIYYTLDGTTPTEESIRYSRELTMSNTCTIKAIAVKENWNNSLVVMNVFEKEPNTIADPQFKRSGNVMTITTATTTEGTVIYYTLDGTEPSAEDMVYTAPVQLTENCILKAVALNDKLFPSGIVTYDVDWFKVDTPVMAVDGNTLIITCSTPDAVIYYDFESSPTSTSSVYTGAIPLTDNRMVFAMAVKKNFHDSEVASVAPDVFACVSPTFSYNGRYLQIQAGEGMTVHYTTDGTKPTEASEICEGQIEINELCTVRAISTRRDFRDSPEAAFTVAYLYDGEEASLNEAGHLEDVFQWIGGTGHVETLAVNGNLNEKDLAFIRGISSLKHLDLTEATYEGDCLPDEAFANLPLISFSSPKQLSTVGSHLFKGCNQLAAVVWNANIAMPENVIEDVKNPNFLLYVNSHIYTPSSYKGNLIPGGQATSITLSDSETSGNFYCPQRFYVQRISYTHNYQQTTESGVTRGWETLALPFDVETITHEKRGALAPFAKGEDITKYKPFWLYELKETGFDRSADIKAYTPYILSMPNNPEYADDYNLAGNVTFTANNVYIETDTAKVTMKGSVKFTPTMLRQEQNVDVLAINLTDYTAPDGTFYESGSAFISDMREVRPFEAYALVNSASRALELSSYLWGELSDIRSAEMKELEAIGMKRGIYDLSGRRLSNDSSILKKNRQQHQRVLIINGKKTLLNIKN